MAEAWFFEVLPCRPPPYPGECLTGYLLRLAQANQFSSFWDLVKVLFPTWQAPHQISLLRWEYPVDDWGCIPLRTQLPLTDLKKLTAAPWIEKFRPSLAFKQHGYMSPGHFLRGVVSPHLQVCPLCLQAQPYLRLMWRLVPVQVCLDHDCLLQTECHRCGTPLTVVGPAQRHLRCAACDADLRTLPIVAASADVLTAQRRQMAELQFLLDPTVTLVNDSTWDPREAIGLKFRYLRSLTGCSVTAMARQVGVFDVVISNIELGRYASSFPLYLAYLKALSWSWSDFAALEVPQEFVHSLQEPPYMPLRLCPTPNCPNHQPPPGLGVCVLIDIPERRIVRFRCTACGRRFTRSYDGELMTKPRRPPIRPGEPPTVVKSAEEIAHLTELGLQGLDNRQIAHQLGWGEKTVRMYWISLNLEKQVHQAQAKRRAKEQQARHSALHDRVETILLSMLSQEEEITLSRVSQALGFNSEYLGNHPDLKERVKQAIREHNIRIKQHRYERLAARIARLIEKAERGDGTMTIKDIAERAGLSYSRLCSSYPELYQVVRQAAREHQVRMRILHTETRCAQINEAAARLVAQGSRLTHRALLKEVGLHKCSAQADPAVQDLLRRWVGDFPSGD
jgi:AraC-like DNA-binding protein/DNA-binding XRE family transcriptional regulator